MCSVFVMERRYGKILKGGCSKQSRVYLHEFQADKQQCGTVVLRRHSILEEHGSNPARNQLWLEVQFGAWVYILRKNGMVCVLVVHHSLDFMRTNNKKGYKYTNFRNVIQQCNTVWHSGTATAQDFRGGWFEPGSNLGKEDQLLWKNGIMCVLIEYHSLNFMRTNNGNWY